MNDRVDYFYKVVFDFDNYQSRRVIEVKFLMLEGILSVVKKSECSF